LEHFQQPIEKYHTVGTFPKTNRKMNVPTVWYFSIGCWKCSNSVVFFYWLLGMFQQCGIFLLVVGNVPTVWYFSIGCWKCSDSVIFFHTLGTIPTTNRKIPHGWNIPNNQ
jgi:hypothetical protein